MSTRFFVVDSGGTSRLIKRWAVVDSGGTTRMLKRAFVVDSGGTSRLIFVSSAAFTLTGGSANDGFVYQWVGYDLGGGPTGSLSPGGTGNLSGVTFQSLLDYFPFGGGAYQFSQFVVSGLGADPGQNGFFNSVVVGAITRTAAAANGGAGGSILAYSYSAGTAIWTWSAGVGAFGMTNGGNSSVTVNF
jgi:hypothetical protein